MSTPVYTVEMYRSTLLCKTCEHSEMAHQHMRTGTDCSVSKCDCRLYVLPKPTKWARIIKFFRGY